MSFLKHKRKEMTVTGKQTKLKRCLYASAAIAVILSGTVTQTTTQVLAAPINGTHNSVGLDPDTKRTDFEAAATHPDANKSKTSIKILLNILAVKPHFWVARRQRQCSIAQIQINRASNQYATLLL